MKIAIVGATGVVGTEILQILEESQFPVSTLKLFASEDSIGRSRSFRGREIPVESLNGQSFEGCNLAFFTAGAPISLKYVPQAARSGAWVIDNTSAFRMEPDVPLVVPEINTRRIAGGAKRKIIANPNCSTTQLVMVLAPLMTLAPIRRVVVATYQSVSGAGREAMEELSEQSVAQLAIKKLKKNLFPHEIAFNLIPEIDVFLEDGYSKEEWKVMQETQKILEKPIAVTATCVRVPVFYGHSEAVNIEFEREVTPQEAKKALQSFSGVVVLDDPASHSYPTPKDVAGKDAVFVGRIRKDPTLPSGLNLWICADNVRKGAALNAVQIARSLLGSFI